MQHQTKGEEEQLGEAADAVQHGAKGLQAAEGRKGSHVLIIFCFI